MKRHTPNATIAGRIVVAALLATAIALSGCASGKSAEQAGDQAQAPTHTPPTADDADYAHKPPPKSAEVKIDGDQDAAHVERDKDDAPAESATRPASTRSDEAAATVSRAQIEALMERGPAYGLRAVTVEPARKAGSFQGFAIVSMTRPAQEALEPHLTTGDVITHLNGVRMRTPDDYLNAWKLLDEVSQIRIDFIRDDQAHHATWVVE